MESAITNEGKLTIEESVEEPGQEVKDDPGKDLRHQRSCEVQIMLTDDSTDYELSRGRSTLYEDMKIWL